MKRFCAYLSLLCIILVIGVMGGVEWGDISILEGSLISLGLLVAAAWLLWVSGVNDVDG